MGDILYYYFINLNNFSYLLVHWLFSPPSVYLYQQILVNQRKALIQIYVATLAT